jgi:hypothetical protein
LQTRPLPLISRGKSAACSSAYAVDFDDWGDDGVFEENMVHRCSQRVLHRVLHRRSPKVSLPNPSQRPRLVTRHGRSEATCNEQFT